VANWIDLGRSALFFKDLISFYHEKEMPIENNHFKLSTSEGCTIEGSLNIGILPALVKMVLENN